MSRTIQHRLASYGFVLGLVITALLVPLVLSHAIVRDSDRVHEEIADGSGYEEIVDVIVERAAEADGMRQLSKSSLAMKRHEIRDAIQDELQRETVSEVIESVYQQTIEQSLAPSEKKVVADVTVIQREVLRGIRKRLVEKLHELPDCEAGDDVETVWNTIEGKLTGDSGTEILASLPDCRPVGPVRSRIEKAIQERIESMHEKQEVTLEKADERAPIVVIFRWVDKWASGAWLLLWAGLLAAAIAGFIWSRRALGEPWGPGVRLGGLIVGAAWVVFAILVFLSAAPIFRATASTSESAEIGSPLVQALATAGSWRLAVLGLAVLGIAGVSAWRARRG